MAGRIMCVVEGDGECTAVPVLVDRMLERMRRHRRWSVDRQRILCAHNGDRITVPYNAARQLGVEFFVGRAARERPRPAAVLVIVDAEQRCVDRHENGDTPLGPHLLARAQSAAGDIPVGLVVANRMFESWFLADFHSLQSRGQLPAAARFDRWRTPEAVAGCKGWMRQLLGRPYSETVDQSEFAKHVSLPVTQPLQARAPSFFKLYREVDRLSQEAR